MHISLHCFRTAILTELFEAELRPAIVGLVATLQVHIPLLKRRLNWSMCRLP